MNYKEQYTEMREPVLNVLRKAKNLWLRHRLQNF